MNPMLSNAIETLGKETQLLDLENALMTLREYLITLERLDFLPSKSIVDKRHVLLTATATNINLGYFLEISDSLLGLGIIDIIGYKTNFTINNILDLTIITSLILDGAGPNDDVLVSIRFISSLLDIMDNVFDNAYGNNMVYNLRTTTGEKYKGSFREIVYLSFATGLKNLPNGYIDFLNTVSKYILKPDNKETISIIEKIIKDESYIYRINDKLSLKRFSNILLDLGSLYRFSNTYKNLINDFGLNPNVLKSLIKVLTTMFFLTLLKFLNTSLDINLVLNSENWLGLNLGSIYNEIYSRLDEFLKKENGFLATNEYFQQVKSYVKEGDLSLLTTGVGEYMNKKPYFINGWSSVSDLVNNNLIFRFGLERYE